MDKAGRDPVGGRERLDSLVQQLEELEAVEAVHPGCLVLDPTEAQSLALARDAAAAATASGELGWAPPEIGGVLRPAGARLGGAAAAVRFSLPPHYPESPARLALECSARREAHDALSADLRRLAAEWAGGPCLLLAVDWLLEAAAQSGNGIGAGNGEPEARHDSAISGDGSGPADGAPQRRLRAAVWFHHIKSTTKRKHIVAWARELGIAGASKPGMPGVIVCEGAEPAVREYLARLRSLKWQAMQVRAEELLNPAEPEAAAAGASGGFGPGPLIELPETCMSELGQLCRTAGSEDLFKAVLKL